MTEIVCKLMWTNRLLPTALRPSAAPSVAAEQSVAVDRLPARALRQPARRPRRAARRRSAHRALLDRVRRSSRWRMRSRSRGRSCAIRVTSSARWSTASLSDSPWSNASSRRPVRAPPSFTRVERYAHMDRMPFAFNLLTRSGRVTHANLAQLAAIQGSALGINQARARLPWRERGVRSAHIRLGWTTSERPHRPRDPCGLGGDACFRGGATARRLGRGGLLARAIPPA